MKQKYKGAIYSNHALKRMHERKIKQKDVWLTWYKPDSSRYAKSKQAWIYYKTFNSKKFGVVAKQNNKKEWVILSAWSKPITKTKSFKKNSSFFSFINKLINKL